MKKLEMPQNYYSEEFGITIRPYVKAVDIVEIAETALMQDNSFEQEVCVAANVIGLCTDVDIDDTINDLDVDTYFAECKLEKQQNRDEALQLLKTVAESEESTSEVKDKANNDMITIGM